MQSQTIVNVESERIRDTFIFNLRYSKCFARETGNQERALLTLHKAKKYANSTKKQ